MCSPLFQCSDKYNTHSKYGSDSDCETEEVIAALHPTHARTGAPHMETGSTRQMKKPVELNSEGKVVGSMAQNFLLDIKKYAKTLDPTVNWEEQPRGQKIRFYKRVYTGNLSPVY